MVTLLVSANAQAVKKVSDRHDADGNHYIFISSDVANVNSDVVSSDDVSSCSSDDSSVGDVSEFTEDGNDYEKLT